MKRYTIIITLFLIIAISLYFTCMPIIETLDYKMCDNVDSAIKYKSWWGEVELKSRIIFSYIFENVIKERKYDKIEVYSVFGDSPKNKNSNTLYVQFSGESNYKNITEFDINFIPSDIITTSTILFPYAYFHILLNYASLCDTCDTYNDVIYELILKRSIINKNMHNSRFCIFSVTNDSCKERNDFFWKLTRQYKKIDSSGKLFNNITMPQNTPDEGHGSKNYIDFITNYKFMICFENVSAPNYLTEKLINAYCGKTIPIYWGCPNISDFVNMDAILYLKPNFTDADVEELIDEIIRLDNDDELYRNKYETAFFRNGTLPDEFNIDKIKEKVENILIL